MRYLNQDRDTTSSVMMVSSAVFRITWLLFQLWYTPWTPFNLFHGWSAHDQQHFCLAVREPLSESGPFLACFDFILSLANVDGTWPGTIRSVPSARLLNRASPNLCPVPLSICQTNRNSSQYYHISTLLFASAILSSTLTRESDTAILKLHQQQTKLLSAYGNLVICSITSAIRCKSRMSHANKH